MNLCIPQGQNIYQQYMKPVRNCLFLLHKGRCPNSCPAVAWSTFSSVITIYPLLRNVKFGILIRSNYTKIRKNEGLHVKGLNKKNYILLFLCAERKQRLISINSDNITVKLFHPDWKWSFYLTNHSSTTYQGDLSNQSCFIHFI